MKARASTGFLKWLIVTFACAGTLVGIYYIFRLSIGGFIFDEQGYLGLLLSLFAAVFFIAEPATNRARTRVPWYDLAFAAFVLAAGLYILVNSRQIAMMGWGARAPLPAVILGTGLWLISLEGARRTGGWGLFGVVLAFSIYPMISAWLPGFLLTAGYSFYRTVSFYYASSEGFWGLTTKVLGQTILGYMIMGVALQVFGGGDFFLKLAMSVMGKFRGGAAKTGVVASSFFGMLSGSAISNVITIGAFTIPAMKKTGYSPDYAAAVEACSSTGGVLMPPVMGATAFLMATFLDISYAEVCIAAAIPSFLYYLSLLTQVDFQAARRGIQGLPKADCPPLGKTLAQGWFYLATLVLLVYILVWRQADAVAPFWATLFLIACTFLRRETRLTGAKMIAFMEQTGRLLGSMTVILLSLGLIIGSVMLTGVGNAFASAVGELAGRNTLLLLVVGAAASLFLGMGMTITACYVFLAVVVGPPLINFGIPPIAAHLFFLYWGMASYITPPVAVASITAASLAGSSPMKTGFQAMRLGFVAYVVPFFFVFNPSLLLSGTASQIALALGSAIVGVYLMAAGVERWFLGIGGISTVAGLLMIFSGLVIGLYVVLPWYVVATASILVVGVLLHAALRKMYSKQKVNVH